MLNSYSPLCHQHRAVGYISLRIYRANSLLTTHTCTGGLVNSAYSFTQPLKKWLLRQGGALAHGCNLVQENNFPQPEALGVLKQHNLKDLVKP